MTIEYIQRTFQLLSNSSEPIYTQLANYFRRLVNAKVLVPGEKMPPEEEMCRALNVSRTTMRQAINLLVDEGLLVRYRAKGTFVSERKLTRRLNHLYNFTSDMKSIGMTPSSTILNQRLEDLRGSYIQQKLDLPDQLATAFRLSRVRCANGQPVLLEDTYIPSYLCPGIEQYDFSHLSLYDILKQVYNLQPVSASETLQAIIIPARERKILNCPNNTVGYRINRVGRLNSHCTYEYTTSITRADICLYQFEMNNTAQTNSTSAIVIQDGDGQA